MKNICNPTKINTFINTNPKRGVDHMISVFDNSLEGLPTNPRKPERKMQQHTDLLSMCFINDFQWRQKRNKGKRNKGRALVVKNNSELPLLFCFCRRCKVPVSAYFVDFFRDSSEYVLSLFSIII